MAMKAARFGPPFFYNNTSQKMNYLFIFSMTCIIAARPVGPEPILRYRHVVAHEAMNGHRQKGYLYSLSSNDSWYAIDFSDPGNSCVKILGEGEARIGGQVVDGNVAVGRFMGTVIHDFGQPSAFLDTMEALRFVGPGGPDDEANARANFLQWCEDGIIDFDWPTCDGDVCTPCWETCNVDRIWPQIVVEGNVKVHH
jgi:hypothetical protein